MQSALLAPGSWLLAPKAKSTANVMQITEAI